MRVINLNLDYMLSGDLAGLPAKVILSMRILTHF